jgi:hypothetical protein
MLAQAFNAKTSAPSFKLFSHWFSFMNLRSIGDLLRREHVWMGFMMLF